jgi:hypothetical protein
MTAPAGPGPSPSIWKRGDHEVSLARLYVLRAVYLFFAVDGFLVTLPLLLAHSPGERGLFLGVKGGLWLMGLIGLRYPLGMLPVLLFELWWKLVWLCFIGLPQWATGTGSPRLADDLFFAGLLPLLLAPVLIPWGYVWRHYVKAPAERWR